MWVSGSLMRSSTCRSSSVSAPCISRSMCLPSSLDRSRTMRGSFCQALPIGCIRVCITPSCNSAVTLDRRCSGVLNSDSSWRRPISRSWLRVSTSSETMVISFSSVSTETRIDWLPLRSASSLAASPSGDLARRCGGSTGVARKARSRSSSESSPGSSGRSSTCSTRVPTACCCGCAGVFGLALLVLERLKDLLDAVDGGEDQRDGVGGRRHTVAEAAHQRFGGMRQGLEARQAEEAAGTLDRVNETKDVVDDGGVAGLPLETHELDVDDVETLVRLGHELPQQVVHRETPLPAGTGPPPRRPSERRQSGR